MYLTYRRRPGPGRDGGKQGTHGRGKDIQREVSDTERRTQRWRERKSEIRREGKGRRGEKRKRRRKRRKGRSYVGR